MNRLLLGTTNPGKLVELTLAFEGLRTHGIEIVALHNMLKLMKPDETGSTFEENAKLKAKFYAHKTGLPAVADDGGLEIDILNGEPGIKSRRWINGSDATDEELIQFTLQKLTGVPKEKRTAKLTTCICFYDPEKDVYLCEQESIDGYIAVAPTEKITNGYPYRALFIVNKFNKYYDELTEEEHQQVNHRRKAAERLRLKIEENLLQ